MESGGFLMGLKTVKETVRGQGRMEKGEYLVELKTVKKMERR